jgi:hypothetical protein
MNGHVQRAGTCNTMSYENLGAKLNIMFSKAPIHFPIRHMQQYAFCFRFVVPHTEYGI